ncbi:MAG: tetratricopeptide repeat protein [Hyphomicrobiaceae bacterium]
MANGVSLRTYASGARVAAVAVLALSLGACSQSSGLLMSAPEVPDVSASRVAEMPRSEAEKAAEHWGKQHASQPRNGKAALNYARSLKALDRKPEALAVLQSSYLYNAQDREYLSEFGRLALDQGHAPMAQQLLERADDPAKPDWRVLSARGVALAQQGEYKAAIPFLERARALAPAQPSIINNLALAYTMDGQAAQAEPMLRQATATSGADPRVRQNLALVLQLQGKKEEATRVAAGDDLPLPPAARPMTVAARPAPVAEPAKVAAATPSPQPAVARKELPPVRTASNRAPAPASAPPAVAPAAEADPDAIIRAAIQAEVAHEQERSRYFPTASAPQR